MTRAIAITAAAIALGAVVGFSVYARRGREPARAAPTEPAATGVAAEVERAEPGQPATQSAELALLRQQVAYLQREMLELRERSSKASEPAAAAARTEGRPSEEDRKAAAEAWHKHMEGVEAGFFEEAHDSHWSASMTSAVKDVATHHKAIDTSLRRIDCRSFTCRIELKDDGSGKIAEELPEFLRQVGDDLPTMQSEQVVASNGEKLTVLFLERDKPSI